MKKALQYREYRDTKPFQAPEGIVSIEIDPASGMPATPSCPKTRREVYIADTQPVGVCPLHGSHQMITNVAGWETEPPAKSGEETAPRITGSTPEIQQPPRDSATRRAARQSEAAESSTPTTPPPSEPKSEKKRGFLGRLWDRIKK
jgi:penicillin-binding protein 1B